MKIVKLTRATKGAVRDINKLLSQLRENPQSPGKLSELRDIVSNKNVVMMVVLDEGHVVGMATLYILQVMGKRKSIVEDVVVDSAYRGRGLGKKLMRSIIVAARSKGVKGIKLTSRPERKAANELYKKLGFKLHNTNAYRMSL